jgi:hypothetical protein
VKASHTIRPVFDDPNLVSAAGLVPVLRLAESAGLYDLVREHLSVDSPNATAKTTSVIGGMLAGADSIDDLDLLRHGGMPRLFAGIRAPSTLGTFLRSFTHGHVQQLDKVSSRLLTGLAGRVPGLIAGAENRDGIAFIDVDDTVREVHGYAKQGAAYGYTGKRGLNIQLAAISTPLAAPVIGRARLRKGNTNSAKGAGRMLAQTITTARAAGVKGQIMARADSAYYAHAFVGTAIRHKTWFSVTARMTKTVTAAIASIEESAWQAIKYPHAVWEDEDTVDGVPGGGYWVSDAEVAEVPFTAFTGRRKHEHVSCRLIIRRVKRIQPAAADGSEQGELFTTYRHHGFITNSTLGMVEADQRHRDHAIVEQVIAELKDNALAHLPSGKYAANAAWVACAVMAFNIARAAAVAANITTARWASVRTKIINLPGRIATTARRLDLHLPTHWPWAHNWESLHAVATGPPVALT